VLRWQACSPVQTQPTTILQTFPRFVIEKLKDNESGTIKECNMKHTEFFQLQAGNLKRDFKTQYQDEEGLTQYKPLFFMV
jgi:hypothetical protein